MQVASISLKPAMYKPQAEIRKPDGLNDRVTGSDISQSSQLAIHPPKCTIPIPEFPEIAVSTAIRNSIERLSMPEVTRWRW